VYLSPEFAQMRKAAAATDLGMALQAAQPPPAPPETPSPNDNQSMTGPAADRRMNPQANAGMAPDGLQQQIIAQGLQNRDVVQSQAAFR